MIKNSSYVSRQPIAPIHLSIQPNAWPIFRECSTPSFHRHFIICTFGIGYVLYKSFQYILQEVMPTMITTMMMVKLLPWVCTCRSSTSHRRLCSPRCGQAVPTEAWCWLNQPREQILWIIQSFFLPSEQILWIIHDKTEIRYSVIGSVTGSHFRTRSKSQVLRSSVWYLVSKFVIVSRSIH